MPAHPALPDTLPLFPIRGCILLPGEALPLNVFEPRYLNMVDDAMSGNGFLGIIQPRETGPREHPDLERVGTAGRIAKHTETSDGRYLIVLVGVSRFTLTAQPRLKTPYRVGRADYAGFEHDIEGPPADEAGADRAGFLALLQRFFQHAGIEADWSSMEHAPLSAITGKVAMAAPFDAACKQALLQASKPCVRRELLTSLMEGALEHASRGPSSGPAGRLH
ncbi:ATP-dependent protease [Glycocaulis albus]|jgi:Lon protease-like protein|uniref:ATP-dependent protease n=1 Tax=Glycocaulis albus TaxID=1382801 RepID=A0ABQ1XBH6_9PROT|nr:LON peptidase substrate-binding domain-containing protein [Glycocaulis albus]MBV5256814.1 peptidase S16 [Synechococcus moorigangaii CMS01]GGG89147.1 ATP-dependent protease [Glycocaulis albus]